MVSGPRLLDKSLVPGPFRGWGGGYPSPVQLRALILPIRFRFKPVLLYRCNFNQSLFLLLTRFYYSGKYCCKVSVVEKNSKSP